jgi:hypothetical protein
MPLTLEEQRSLLRTVIRSIDRKADFSASLQEGDQPGLIVSVSLRKYKANVFLSTEQIEGATQDSMRRSQLRTTIKRALDRAMFEPATIASTKMMRGKVIEGGYFRSDQGRGGRR